MRSAASVALLLVSVCSTASAQEGWPQWLGKNRDNKSTETGLLKAWPEGGPKLVWKSDLVGLGYSTVAVTGGRIYILGNLEDGAYLMALGEADGKLVWKTKVAPPPTHGQYPGARATPTVDGKRVYILAEEGELLCCELEGGKEVWRKNMKKDFGGKVGAWMYSESPLVDGKNLVCIPGGKDGAILALDKETGATVWRTKDFTDGAEYTSLYPTEIGGVKQYVAMTMNSVVGVGQDGKLLWKGARPQGKVAICTTPVARDGIVFVSSAYGIGCTAYTISANGGKFSAELRYEGRQMENHHGGVILLEDHVYGLTQNKMECIDFKTGKVVWSDKSVGKGAITYADGHFIVRSERASKGEIALVEATPTAYKEKGRFSLPDPSGKNTWAYPVVANGKLYIRNQGELYCYDVKAK